MEKHDLEFALDALSSKKRELSEAVKEAISEGPEAAYAYATYHELSSEELAALEKARGETAALRHLANAAQMIDRNPNLMQLRILQAFGQQSGNTLVLGVPPAAHIVPLKGADAE